MANLMKLPAFGKGRAVQYDPLDEESYGELPAMGEPTAPPSSLGEPNAPSWKTSDELRETIRNRPKLERATGWKGVLQTIGDAVVNPELMHPKYTHQVREYDQKVDDLTALKKLEDQEAEEARRQSDSESLRSANAYRTETAKKQGALYDKQLAKLGEPERRDYKPVGSFGYQDPEGRLHLVNTGDKEPTAGEAFNLNAIKRKNELLALPARNAEEELELKSINEMLKRRESEVSRNQSQVSFNLSGVGWRGADTAETKIDTERKSRDGEVKKIADKLVGENGNNVDQALSAMSNEQYYGWLNNYKGDSSFKGAVAQELMNRKGKKGGSGVGAAILAAIGEGKKAQPAAAANAATAPNPAATEKKTAAKEPPVGTVEDGYRYIGGGASNPRNWVKVN